MANSFKLTDLVVKDAVRIMHEKAAFIGQVDRQYDETFTGSKQGDTIRVRYPNKYNVREGSRIMDVQDQTETNTTITLATQDGVDMRFNSAELATSIDQYKGFSKRFVEPAVARLVSLLDYKMLAFATKATNQVAGTAGTAMTDLTAVGLARAKLNQQLAPKNDRCIMGDSIVMAGMSNGLKGLFQDSEQIKKQYREGLMGRTAGADWYENDRIWTMTNTADVAGEINAGTLTSGITSLTVDGLTVAPTQGMVFTVEGVYEIHPETRVVYPHLKQFVVGSGSTTTNLVFSPAIIYDTSNAYQNASGAPVDNADITFVGAASTSYAQQLMFQKEAYQFVSVDLPKQTDVESSVYQFDGLSLRVNKGYDMRNDELLMRIDILYGMAALRPEWGCRMIGSAG
jgi:hypothetical protein